MPGGSPEVVAPEMEAINRAFSRQATHYDEHDQQNQVLVDMRRQVYEHLHRFLQPNSRILELNAGTGIDALHFANGGHFVLATDLSEGMVKEIKKKIDLFSLPNLDVKQLSYTQLDQLGTQSFDYVFSNFGGLNCTKDLKQVTRHLPHLLKPRAFVTWVVMPKVCLWEIGGLVVGHGKKAFRRFGKNGALAHLEDEHFVTYYHSLRDIQNALGPSFKLIRSEGLCALSPPPHRGDFPRRHRNLYRFLRRADRLVRDFFPFNRWADHLVMTFQYEVLK